MSGPRRIACGAEAFVAHRPGPGGCRRVRVTLDLNGSATERLTGFVSYDEGAEPVAFDGWLELMRLLESITAGTSPLADPVKGRTQP
jgi:hypothetical protein